MNHLGYPDAPAALCRPPPTGSVSAHLEALTPPLKSTLNLQTQIDDGII